MTSGLLIFKLSSAARLATKNCRLTHIGRFERVGGTLHAQPPQVDSQNLASQIKQRADRRQLLIKLAAHPHELGTLARKQKGGFGHG